MYTRTRELLITGPTVEPVTVEECALHLRETTHDNDELLAGLIVTARQLLEEHCWSAFIAQTWQYWWDRFECRLFIPRPPLRYCELATSINAFQYVAPGAATPSTYTTVPAATWELSAENQRPFLREQYCQTWPTIRGYKDDVTVKAISGYGGAAADVPMPIRHAIKLLVAHLYANPGDTTPEKWPPAIDALIAPYRFHGEGGR